MSDGLAVVLDRLQCRCSAMSVWSEVFSCLRPESNPPARGEKLNSSTIAACMPRGCDSTLKFELFDKIHIGARSMGELR